jgi:hypothetical protein
MQVPAPPPADKIKSRIAARQSSHGCNDIELLAARLRRVHWRWGCLRLGTYEWHEVTRVVGTGPRSPSLHDLSARREGIPVANEERRTLITAIRPYSLLFPLSSGRTLHSMPVPTLQAVCCWKIPYLSYTHNPTPSADSRSSDELHT